MANYRRLLKRYLFLTTFFFAAAAFTLSVVVWVQFKPATPLTPGSAPTPSPAVPDPAPSSVPTLSPTATPSPVATATAPPQEEPTPTNNSGTSPAPGISFKLAIPVAGLKPAQLRDTFTEARTEGRVHNAIDIIAPRGAQVLAATNGKIVKLFNSVRGGTTIYQSSADQKWILYYAHLDRYADGLTEGRVANQGELIGYVGDTGNAGAGNTHLHFAVWSVTDPKRYWDGININPYPLLREAQPR